MVGIIDWMSIAIYLSCVEKWGYIDNIDHTRWTFIGILCNLNNYFIIIMELET